MIRVRLVSKSFGGVPVLGRISLDIAEGETVAVLGPSGIGKTTLLRVVAGLDADFEGRVDCARPLAMVFQEPTLLPWRTAMQNLRVVHPGLSRAAAQDMLARVGLTDRARAYPGQLSLGQQRRLALARAFAGRPRALVLDEPFASLDPGTAGAMLALTEGLIAAARPATLLVTHALAEAERLASRILVLDGQPATLQS